MNWLHKLLHPNEAPEVGGPTAAIGSATTRAGEIEKLRAELRAREMERRVAALEVVFDEQSREQEERTTEMARRLAALETEFATQSREREAT